MRPQRAASRAIAGPCSTGSLRRAHRGVSRAPFFALCGCIVVAWLVISLPLSKDLKEWQTAIHTVASVLTLLSVALLENASRRAEEAAQEKLNVIAEALAELVGSGSHKDPDLQMPRITCDVVGLEGFH